MISMENWKLQKPKLNIESRNLSISSFNLTNVQDYTAYFDLNFSKVNEISKGGNEFPDFIKATVKDKCVLFKEIKFYNKELKKVELVDFQL